MKKNILNLDGVVTLTKQQQKSINGGFSTVNACRVTCGSGFSYDVTTCNGYESVPKPGQCFGITTCSCMGPIGPIDPGVIAP